MIIIKVLQVWNVVFLFFGKCVSSERVVMTTTGPLQGVTTMETVGFQIESFLGVPYAEPPIGDLRFKKPVPKTPWTGVLKASSLPPPCIQNIKVRSYWDPDVGNMTEDCLYLNLWVPYSRNGTELKTVIIFIHGGAFIRGSGSMPLYDGTHLARFGDVIVADFNYRVGAMGFFSAFIEDAEGNMGIFDQILAMRWIRDNAKFFGGDTDNIVLVGQSAGAMSVSGHLISPLTRNLFRRVILQSGSFIVPVFTEDNAMLHSASQNLATLVGCADKLSNLKDKPRSVLQCLKEIPAEVLSAAEGQMTSGIIFCPRVGDSYLPNLAIKSLQKGDFSDVEMLIGFNEEEGSFFLSVAIPQYFGNYGNNRVDSVSKSFALSVVRTFFKFTKQWNEEEIADQYINSVENGTSESYSKAIAMSLGDYLINCNAFFHAEFHSMRNPVYFYVFGRRASSTPLAEWMGTTHFEEVQYIFGNPLFGNFTQEEIEFSHRMMARWIAFAKTGDPNVPGEVTWPLFKYGDPQYIVLDDKESVKSSRPDNYRCEFWRDRYQAQISDDIISAIQKSTNSGIILTSNWLCLIISNLLISILLQHISIFNS